MWPVTPSMFHCVCGIRADSAGNPKRPIRLRWQLNKVVVSSTPTHWLDYSPICITILSSNHTGKVGLNVYASEQVASGIIVASVEAHAPMASVVRTGDVILSIDGISCASSAPQAVKQLQAAFETGRDVEVVVQPKQPWARRPASIYNFFGSLTRGNVQDERAHWLPSQVVLSSMPDDWLDSNVVTVVIKPEGCHVSGALKFADGRDPSRPGIAVAEVPATGPLAGIIYQGDHIASINGEMCPSRAALALKQLEAAFATGEVILAADIRASGASMAKRLFP